MIDEVENEFLKGLDEYIQSWFDKKLTMGDIVSIIGYVDLTSSKIKSIYFKNVEIYNKKQSEEM